jgi:hypothetical protein
VKPTSHRKGIELPVISGPESAMDDPFKLIEYASMTANGRR